MLRDRRKFDLGRPHSCLRIDAKMVVSYQMLNQETRKIMIVTILWFVIGTRLVVSNVRHLEEEQEYAQIVHTSIADRGGWEFD